MPSDSAVRASIWSPKYRSSRAFFVADDHRHHDRRTDAGKAHLGLAERSVVGGDRQVAQHHHLAAAAEHMALHRGNYRLCHQPRRHLEFELFVQVVVRLGRIAAPVSISVGVGAGRLRPDVVAGAEAAPLGAQQHDAGRRVGVGPVKRVEQRVLQLGADRVELVRAVQRDDADLVVDLVQHDRLGHGVLPARPAIAATVHRPGRRTPIRAAGEGRGTLSIRFLLP